MCEWQFLEVSLRFLASRGATLAWIVTEIKAIPSAYPIISDIYGENDLDTEDTAEESEL